MIRPQFATLVLPVALLLPQVFVEPASGGAVPPGAEDLAPVLEPIRQKFAVPALAAAVVRGDRVVAAGPSASAKWARTTRSSSAIASTSARAPRR
jgi:hypothetical protein